MADRVNKKRKAVKPSTERKNLLFAAIAGTGFEMPSCSSCEERGKDTCEVSPLNPDRCVPCVRGGLSHCDVKEFSAKALEKAGKQFHEHELALQEAEEELQQQLRKIDRLRKQKKLWFERMMRAVR